MAQVQICRGFGHKDWQALSQRLLAGDAVQQKERDWHRAVEVFDRRMRERFFTCIEALEAVPIPEYAPVPDDPDPDRLLPGENPATGFAIMALCCPLIETLQTFRTGSFCGTRQAFIAFLKECLAFTGPEAERFEDGIRNGILHNAKTREWIIRRDVPKDRIVERERNLYVLNRTLFCKELRDWFRSYIKQLADPIKNDLRKNFIVGMQHIVDRCDGTVKQSPDRPIHLPID
ncbi:MAG TPA: hypothetical protein VFW94_16610 [Candidatus Acidoferrales bacterium]|nr:hypothetical protein [Candidatus Acidoferrales bacterium]